MITKIAKKKENLKDVKIKKYYKKYREENKDKIKEWSRQCYERRKILASDTFAIKIIQKKAVEKKLKKIETQYNETLQKINEAKGTQKNTFCYDLPCLACGNITKKDISLNKLGDCYKLCYRQNTSENKTVINAECKDKWQSFNDYQRYTLKEAQREYLKRNGIDKF